MFRTTCACQRRRPGQDVTQVHYYWWIGRIPSNRTVDSYIHVHIEIPNISLALLDLRRLSTLDLIKPLGIDRIRQQSSSLPTTFVQICTNRLQQNISDNLADSKFHHACDDLLNPTRKLTNALLVRLAFACSDRDIQRFSNSSFPPPTRKRIFCFTQTDPSSS